MSRIWKVGCTLVALAYLAAAVFVLVALQGLAHGELGSSKVLATMTSAFVLTLDRPVAVRVFRMSVASGRIDDGAPELRLEASERPDDRSIDAARNDVGVSVFDPRTGRRPGSGGDASTLAIEVRWIAPTAGSAVSGVITATATGYYFGEPVSPPPFRLAVTEDTAAHFDGLPATLVAQSSGVVHVTTATPEVSQDLQIDVSAAVLSGALAFPLIGRVRLVAPAVTDQDSAPAARVRVSTPNGIIWTTEDVDFLSGCRAGMPCTVRMTLLGSLYRINNRATIGPSDVVDQPWTIEARVEDLTGHLPSTGLTLSEQNVPPTVLSTPSSP